MSERIDIREKVDELYQEYLKKILDLIFNNPGTTVSKKDTQDSFEGVSRCIKGRYEFNFKDKNGNILSPDLWFHQLGTFKNGYAYVFKDMKYNFIDTKGHLLSPDLWFDSVWSFENDCARVKKDGKCNFINTKGKLISPDIWFDNVFDFVDGYAKVEIDGKCNFINNKGEYLRSDIWFDDANSFHEGYATIVKDNQHNFIDTNGQLLSSDIWFDWVGNFKNGYAIVCKNKEYNFINNKGQFLFPNLWFEYAERLDSGCSIVKNNNKYNIVNANGKLLSPNLWFNKVEGTFENGYAIVYKDNKYNFININGELLLDNWNPINKKDLEIRPISKNFIEYKNRILCITRDLNDFEIRRTLLGGYRCINNKVNDSYNVKYQPIKIFGIRYTLCLKDKNIYLYDRILNQYTLLGDIYNIGFDDNFIFDRKNNKVYLIYENKEMLDITDYYNRYLKDSNNISINSGVTDIFTRDEFSLNKRDEIDKLIEEYKERIIERKKKEEIEKKEKELKKAQEDAKKKDELRRAEQKKELQNLSSVLKRIKELDKDGENERISGFDEDDLFIDVEDHREIRSFYLETGLLRYIDLNGISFKNVKIAGIDFRGCNIDLRPDEVYEKDLKNCNFEGLYISPLMNFKDVDIRGALFSDDNDPRTIDRMNIFFKDAIYDSTTKYNGISFTELYGECKKLPDKKDI